jgi:hypothetical protein
LFCDDLRQQACGKLSAMGTHQRMKLMPVDDLSLSKLVALSVLKLPV